MSAALPPQLLSARALVERLAAGSPALLPTDTLPALAAQPRFAAQIWRLKQRPPDKPLILMGADLEAFQSVLGSPWQPEWLALAQRGWPGALTLVLPAQGKLVDWLNPGGTSLGLRIPACAQTCALLRLSGPLATTSANRSGEPPARSAGEAGQQFPSLPLLAPLPWPRASGEASTVLAWQRSGDWRVLRAGAFLPPQLEDA